jgi:hypothetical protein
MYSEDYFQARLRFLAAARKAGARVDQLKLGARGPKGEELTIDIASFGDLRAPKLMMHTSGVHGVEGFIGSAVQVAALEKGIQIPDGMGLVFVHILNPFGMAWLRRVNENNVDLNRNFLRADQRYSGPDDSYAKLNTTLNNDTPTGVFFAKVAGKILLHGFEPLKKSVMQGQYDFPASLQYGGSKLEEGPTVYKTWIASHIGKPERVIVIDQHTGLGPWGRESLFRYGDQAVDIGRKVTSFAANVGYHINGGMDSLTPELFGYAKTCVHFTSEIGTMKKLPLLNLMQAFQKARKTGPHNRALLAAMTPQDPEWRRRGLKDALATYDGALRWVIKR